MAPPALYRADPHSSIRPIAICVCVSECRTDMKSEEQENGTTEVSWTAVLYAAFLWIMAFGIVDVLFLP